MKNKPVIHLWLPEIAPGNGGIQSFSRDLLDGLLTLYPSAELEVVIRNDYPDSQDKLFSQRINWSSSSAFPKWLRPLGMVLLGLRAAVLRRPHLIICGHVNFLPAVKIMASFFRASSMVVIYGIEIWKPLSYLKLRAFRATRNIFAISHFTARQAARAQNIPEERIKILPCTFAADRFCIGPKSLHLLERHKLKPDQAILLTVSRLSENEQAKGHAAVIAALPEILRTFPELHYLIVGRGAGIAELQEQARALNVLEHITFTGFISNAELPAYYQLSDIFVMPSVKEGFGIVFLEALGCGKVVIAGNQDAAVEVLNEGKLGILLPPSDSSKIAQAVLEVLGQNSSPNRLTNPADLRAAALERYGRDIFLKKLEAALNQALK